MNARMVKKNARLRLKQRAHLPEPPIDPETGFDMVIKPRKKKRLWSFDAMVVNVTDFIKSDKTGEAALKSVHVAVRDKAMDNLMKHSFFFGRPFSKLAKDAIQTAVNNI